MVVLKPSKSSGLGQISWHKELGMKHIIRMNISRRPSNPFSPGSEKETSVGPGCALFQLLAQRGARTTAKAYSKWR
jgi:hypothetical protein